MYQINLHNASLFQFGLEGYRVAVPLGKQPVVVTDPLLEITGAAARCRRRF